MFGFYLELLWWSLGIRTERLTGTDEERQRSLGVAVKHHGYSSVIQLFIQFILYEIRLLNFKIL